jgi:streptomycin 3"-kinase
LLPPLSDDWTPIDVGESDATVYRRGDVFAKCCGPSGVVELAAERDRVEWLAGTGIPGATVVDWLESSEGACLLTSAVAGVPGDALPPS